MPSRCRVVRVVFLATFVVFGAGASGARIPRLVKDLNTAGAGSGAFLQAEMNGFVYLVASELDHGSELWKTDGTEEGTTLVKDVWPGPVPSDPFFVVNAGGTIFFQPDTEEYGRELWKSDGTEAGTVLVKDILPGPETSFPERFVAVGDTLFFVARDGVHGRELWKSDGSEAGTVLVKDILPGPEQLGLGPLRLTASGDRLFFIADDGSHGEELWISDGTEAGTRLAADLRLGEGSSFPEDLFDHRGTLYFGARSQDNEGLWKTDGTEAGTVLVKSLDLPSGFASVGDTLFFRAREETHGTELWKSDGTEAGTVLVKDLRSGERSSFPSAIVDVDGTAFFFARSQDFEDPELWTSDGTEAGTVLVRKIQPLEGFLPDPALAFDGRLVFAGEGDDRGFELWASDGTAAGTVRIEDIHGGSQSSEPLDLFRFGERVLFSAVDGYHGRELWSTDGSAAGTALLRDINSKGTLDGHGGGLLELDGVLYFAANEPSTGWELWRSDGTGAGTFLVRDINSEGDGLEGPYNIDLVTAGGKLFFFADDGVHGRELWTSDGTRSGTRLVRDLIPSDSEGALFSLLATDRDVYFAGYLGRNSILWRSDGTEEGTLVVQEDRHLDAQPLGSLGGLAFYARGGELWRSDGTVPGTFAIATVDFAGFKGFTVGSFAALGDQLLFVPGDRFSFSPDGELWTTDGTRAGTFVLKDIAAGPEASHPGRLVKHQGRIFFDADDGVHGRELWVSDGSGSGTHMVRDLAPGPGSSNPTAIGGVGDEMFFRTSFPDRQGFEGLEFWRTDGTASGTRFVSPMAPQDELSAAALGSDLYFASRTFEAGYELWKSDGTRKGTTQVVDLLPGFRDSSPRDLTVVGRNLFFSARSGRYGRELWVLGAGTTNGVPGRLTSVPDLDGLGGDEVAALFSNVVVRDAASGEGILETSLAPRGGWDAVDFEPLPDLDGNGSAELAILARERNRIRIFVRDALTGDLLSTVPLRRNRHPLDLEVIPGDGRDPASLVTLTRRGLGGRTWLTVSGPSGENDLDVPLPADFEPLDLEVTPALVRGGTPALIVLGESGPGDRARLLAVDPETGRLLADWKLRDGLVPLDLEIVQDGRKAPGLAAVLVEKNTNGAVRVLTTDLQTGATVKTMRFGKRYRALDLEPEPGRRGSVGPTVALLEARRSDGSSGKVRVSSRNAFSGRRLGTAKFPGVLLSLDLALVRDLDGSGAYEAAVLGEAECAEGGTAIVLRDSEAGSRLGCYPVP